MALPPSITIVCDQLRGKPWRDADATMKREYVMGTEAGQLVRAFEAAGKDDAYRRLSWLVMFTARRALPCWELHCDTDKPQRTVSAVRDWLMTGVEPESWKPHLRAAQPSIRGSRIVDCRACETGCAADAAAMAAKYVTSKDLFYAACSLSSADCAFDQCGLKDDFQKWLFDVAIPAAYDCQELSLQAQRAFREYDEETLKVEREKKADKNGEGKRNYLLIGLIAWVIASWVAIAAYGHYSKYLWFGLVISGLILLLLAKKRRKARG